MKAVNVNDVLKILYKYGEFLFVTDYPKYREMQDEIANLPKVTDSTDAVLDKIRAEIDEKISHYEHFSSSNTANGLMIAKKIIDNYKAESEGKE
jgi:hypothetical protein